MAPIYEYECQKCKRIIEINQSMKDKPLTQCPNFSQDQPGESFYQCKGKLKKIISKIAGFKFIGKGFFRNDYPKN